jgi:hypothetical protein
MELHLLCIYELPRPCHGRLPQAAAACSQSPIPPILDASHSSLPVAAVTANLQDRHSHTTAVCVCPSPKAPLHLAAAGSSPAALPLQPLPAQEQVQLWWRQRTQQRYSRRYKAGCRAWQRQRPQQQQQQQLWRSRQLCSSSIACRNSSRSGHFPLAVG